MFLSQLHRDLRVIFYLLNRTVFLEIMLRSCNNRKLKRLKNCRVLGFLLLLVSNPLPQSELFRNFNSLQNPDSNPYPNSCTLFCVIR